MIDCEREIMLHHILNRMYIEKSMHYPDLGDPEKVKRRASAPKSLDKDKEYNQARKHPSKKESL